VSEEAQQNDLAKKRVVYQIPGQADVIVRRDLEYCVTDAGALTLDLYYPPGAQPGERVPAVIFVAGFPDPGMQRMMGCRLKEMGSYVSWGELTAASGLAAVVYTNREPVADVHALIRYVRQNAASLGIDESRIGLWACSGNVPLALSVLMEEAVGYLKCAALCYGLMLDLEGSTSIAEAAKAFGFANPAAGKSVEDLPPDLPLFIARAGQDQIPHLNEALDRFVAAALRRNLPITLVNHPAAPHAFDVMHDSETAREIIRQILAFLRFYLLA